jgi:hypothetical protein
MDRIDKKKATLLADPDWIWPVTQLDPPPLSSAMIGSGPLSGSHPPTVSAGFG